VPFDFKKEYKEFYLPPKKPVIVNVEKAKYLSVLGKGNPNEEDGEYKKSMQILYSIAFTLKMSPKIKHEIKGFYEYVVPPLEGFWWQEGVEGIDYQHKETYCWYSLIRVHDFITKEEVEWAKEYCLKKKSLDCSKLELMEYEEGLCVQMMHIGPFDEEPKSKALMEQYIKENGYCCDITMERFHHEIYLSDARRVSPDKLKTVIRYPIKKIE